MPKTRRPLTTIAIIVCVALAAALAVAYWMLRPRGSHAVRLKDVAAAKRAGDELLASRDQTFVVVVAHPDDAEWWAGGTLAMLAEHNSVVLVMSTSGDKGMGGPPGMGELREKLQREAGGIIGYAKIVFLRHPDQGLPGAPGYVDEITGIVRRYRPAAVFSFDVDHEGPVYHHDDHEAAGRAAKTAVESLGGTMYLMHTSAPDVLVDYGPKAPEAGDAIWVLQRYHDIDPVVGRLWRALRGSGTGRRMTGSSTAFPEVGVSNGQVFRKATLSGDQRTKMR